MDQSGIAVCLISGFLGSGKTTFLNHMLKEHPRDLKLLILINEFGEESIDGALVEDPELEMLEISKGSIFCACVKGDFIKALYRIAFVLQPEAVVIEASGVANPTDISRDVFNPIFKGMFTSLNKICIIDAANFLEQYNVFASIENQIEAADKFIVNKIELVDKRVLVRIKEVIRRHNPNATFVETSFSLLDQKYFVDFGAMINSRSSLESETETEFLNDEALEKVIDRILENQLAQLSPPENLISITCRWDSGGLAEFRRIADRLPSDVVRAKGFIFDKRIPYLYSHVGHSYDIQRFDGPRLLDRSVNRVVFIRSESKEKDIRSMFLEQGLNLFK
ncbi:MAG: GTP-binding protein [Desulfomonilaceae bacterium]|jgi:G3E family GTPase